MKKPEVISLYLTDDHIHKIMKGKGFQLTKEHLHNAICNNHNCQLHLDKKYVTKLINNHKNGKGIRIASNMLVGGEINFSNN